MIETPVFPTHVGVFLPTPTARPSSSGLPHACGGVSMFQRVDNRRAVSSPRMWGCFQVKAQLERMDRVFPTHVGVFPHDAHEGFCSERLPHACGGVSMRTGNASSLGRSSPRMWGCFLVLKLPPKLEPVFPTHVGVFPIPHRNDERRTRLPHACGGVSYVYQCEIDIKESSPRMWGCFRGEEARLLLRVVFPTHVGVFLLK